MRVTLLGHASTLVEASGRAILIDPVFSDVFGEDALVMCPSRRIRPERLPRIDAIVLSHMEPDHFDIATLAKLPRDRLVLCARDNAMVYALTQLGFKDVRPLELNSLVQFGGCELLTTPSARPDIAELE